MYDWDPPFPVDLTRIRPADEAYWDAYRAAPKAIVVVRHGPASLAKPIRKPDFRQGGTRARNGRRAIRRAVRSGLLEALPPESAGMVFQPVRKQGLAASSGSTDFGGLFVGFSLFLIVSAALLVGLLFRLGVEQRADEVGVVDGVGFYGGRDQTPVHGGGGLADRAGGD